MIVAAGITPYSPLQLPVRKELADFFSPLKSATEKLVQHFVMRRVASLIIIYAHSENDRLLRLNISSPFQLYFSMFSDAMTLPEFVTDIQLTYRMRQALEGREDAAMISHTKPREPALLGLLPFHETGMKIVSVGIPRDAEMHQLIRIGTFWRDIVEGVHRRCGICVLGTLSQALRRGSPFPPLPEGRLFDAKFREAWLNADMRPLFDFIYPQRAAIAETSLAPSLLMQGMLLGHSLCPELYAYDSTTGIGYISGVWW